MQTRTRGAAPEPARDPMHTGRPVARSHLPVLLVALAAALVLAAVNAGGGPGADATAFEGIRLDLGDGSAADPAAGAFGATRPSLRTLALAEADDGRFYAVYGTGPSGDRRGAGHVDGAPRGAAGSEFNADGGAGAGASVDADLDAAEPPTVAGVLVGTLGADAKSIDVHEFAIDSGALRVATQDGRFEPRRFVATAAATPGAGTGAGTNTTHAAPQASVGAVAARQNDAGALPDSAAATPAHRFSGRWIDATGTRPATLAWTPDGALALEQEHCRLVGRVERGAPPAVTGSGRTGDAAALLGPAAVTLAAANREPVRQAGNDPLLRAVPVAMQAQGDACAGEADAEPGAMPRRGHLVRHGALLTLVLPSADLSRGAVFVGTPVTSSTVR